MFGKKTKANIKNGQLIIMTDDARNAGIITLALDHVRNGGFEVAAGENDGHALVFKPTGKKTSETLAVYNKHEQAAAAMKSVFKALSGKEKSGSLLKIIAIIAAVLALLYLLGSWMFNMFVNRLTESMTGDTASGISQSESIKGNNALPLGEAFPAQKFIDATQTQSGTE